MREIAAALGLGTVVGTTAGFLTPFFFGLPSLSEQLLEVVIGIIVGLIVFFTTAIVGVSTQSRNIGR